MIHCLRTNSLNKDFQKLVAELDADLRIRDGADHSFFAQFNKIDNIEHVVVAYDEEVPVGCGAIKKYSDVLMEIKRMYVVTQMRGKGVASLVLQNLEKWAAELNFRKCILETGEKQPEAIALYKKNKYSIIPNYPPYTDVKSSVCFGKTLSK